MYPTQLNAATCIAHHDMPSTNTYANADSRGLAKIMISDHTNTPDSSAVSKLLARYMALRKRTFQYHSALSRIWPQTGGAGGLQEERKRLEESTRFWRTSSMSKATSALICHSVCVRARLRIAALTSRCSSETRLYVTSSTVHLAARASEAPRVAVAASRSKSTGHLPTTMLRYASMGWSAGRIRRAETALFMSFASSALASVFRVSIWEALMWHCASLSSGLALFHSSLGKSTHPYPNKAIKFNRPHILPIPISMPRSFLGINS
mmetsp:Transcript_26388/g.45406  ORF Transcript_26388/g.45406 Transcript_26388/m.45406 type:complete len:265 (-) Transcript_26388:112-906(-)